MPDVMEKQNILLDFGVVFLFFVYFYLLKRKYVIWQAEQLAFTCASPLLASSSKHTLHLPQAKIKQE